MTKTIQQTIHAYIESIEQSHSQNTARSYRNALQAFAALLNQQCGVSPTEKSKNPGEGPGGENVIPWVETAEVHLLSEDAITWFTHYLKDYAPSTEQLYLTAAIGFYEYLAAERLSAPNLSRVQMLARKQARKSERRLPQFPLDQIEQVIGFAINLANDTPTPPQLLDEKEIAPHPPVKAKLPDENPADEAKSSAQPFTPRGRGRPRKSPPAPGAYLPGEAESERLIRLRDRAFILTLADTGLRVHEACKLRRGDIDWNEGRAILIGKGDQEAVVRFSQRSLAALKDYLAARARLDGAFGRPLPALPLFARHDRGAGKKVKPITTTTGRNIIDQRCKEALGDADSGSITPHSFRHYFVTTVLRGSGGNLKMAQEMARHKNIAVTERYAHLSNDELDQGYYEIFDEQA